MLETQKLLFAKKYPFSETAKSIVKKEKINFDKISEQAIKRSLRMILEAKKNREFSFANIEEDSEILKDSIVSFPLAKIFLSYVNDELLSKNFVDAYAKMIFSNLEKEKDSVLFDLLSEQKINFELGDNFFCAIPITIFLSTEFNEDFMKLVNQKVESGRVYMSRNELCRLISQKIKAEFLASMPVSLSGIPTSLLEIAKEVKAQLTTREEKEIKEKLGDNYSKKFGAGYSKLPLDIEAFPPCIKKIFDDFMQGKNVPHNERFYFATFTVNVGFPIDKIIQIYSRTPNFDQKITRYHLENIKGKGEKPRYSAMSCDKVKEQGMCVADCNVKHPVQYYRKKVFNRPDKNDSDMKDKSDTNDTKDNEDAKNDSAARESSVNE